MPLPVIAAGALAAAARAAAVAAARFAARVAIPAAKRAIKKHGPKIVKKGKELGKKAIDKGKELAKKAKEKAKKTWEKLKNKKKKDKSGSCESCKNRAQHEKLKDQYRRQMEKPSVKDPKLKKKMDELYRDNAKIGNGSTADAVRHEIATGKPVGGKWHTQKAKDSIVNLNKWLKSNPNASSGDRAAAQNVIRDLQNALSGK